MLQLLFDPPAAANMTTSLCQAAIPGSASGHSYEPVFDHGRHEQYVLELSEDECLTRCFSCCSIASGCRLHDSFPLPGSLCKDPIQLGPWPAALYII